MILYWKLWNFDLLWEKIRYCTKNYGTLINEGKTIVLCQKTSYETSIYCRKNYGSLPKQLWLYVYYWKNYGIMEKNYGIMGKKLWNFD